jgi:ribosomal protein L37AE/L43A
MGDMQADDGARREAEARLADARAQLRDAEAAHRRISPCEHRKIRHVRGAGWNCADCGTAVDDPRGCQHYRIDNDTWLCVECGERMLGQNAITRTAMSAPNVAACTNPDCSGDVNDPRCENPHGIYMPDRSRQREMPIRVDFTYRCERCQYYGLTITSGNRAIWDCGHDHHGDSIPIHTAEVA